MRTLLTKFTFIFVMLLPLTPMAQAINYNSEKNAIGNHISYLEDKDGVFSIDQVVANPDFVKNKFDILNFNVSNSYFWLKLEIKNLTENERLFINIDQPRLDKLDWYEVDNTGAVIDNKTYAPLNHFNEREFRETSYLISLDNFKKGQVKNIYMRVHCNEQVILPIFIRDEKNSREVFITKNFVSGIYIGVIFVMILYNLFVYFSVKDITYIYYVLYFAFSGLTHMTIEGLTYKYLWPGSVFIEAHSLLFFSNVAGIVTTLFIKSFLRTKEFTPKFDKIFTGIIAMFIISTTISFFGFRQAAFIIMQNVTLLGAIFAIIVAIVVYRKGYKPANFFLIAWSILIAGGVVFILKDYGILPYNNITRYSMQAASGLESILLSIALGDKINVLRQEKLAAIKETENILKEQNITLENLVEARTEELDKKNNDLNLTLSELKETQAQLVQSEKMSSLGQLTAGIAHEINNPMNYAKQSVVTIKKDMKDLRELLDLYSGLDINQIEDLKDKLEEIEDLREEIELDYLHGEIDEAIEDVEDGIKRAVEIASELKTFSRIDEAIVKVTDITLGISSTLELMKSEFGNSRIIVETDLQELPEIECRASKLNQVFMNILNNSIHAIKESENADNGKITVSTELINDGEAVKVIFTDNGKGMSEETLSKMFDPFYTTKEVGQGSGLGMSISYGIIHEHDGKLVVDSVLGEGTTITIQLPKRMKLNTDEGAQD